MASYFFVIFKKIHSHLNIQDFLFVCCDISCQIYFWAGEETDWMETVVRSCLGKWLCLCLCKNMCSACFEFWLHPLTNIEMHLCNRKKVIIKMKRLIIPVPVQMLLIMPFMWKNMNKADLWLSKRQKKGETPILCQILKWKILKGKRNRKFESAEQINQVLKTMKKYCHYHIH